MSDLFVREEFRRRKYGMRLWTAIAKVFTNKLHVSISAKLKANSRFHEKRVLFLSFFPEIVQVAEEVGADHFTWSVLPYNKPALCFYHSVWSIWARIKHIFHFEFVHFLNDFFFCRSTVSQRWLMYMNTTNWTETTLSNSPLIPKTDCAFKDCVKTVITRNEKVINVLRSVDFFFLLIIWLLMIFCVRLVTVFWFADIHLLGRCQSFFLQNLLYKISSKTVLWQHAFSPASLLFNILIHRFQLTINYQPLVDYHAPRYHSYALDLDNSASITSQPCHLSISTF